MRHHRAEGPSPFLRVSAPPREAKGVHAEARRRGEEEDASFAFLQEGVRASFPRMAGPDHPWPSARAATRFTAISGPRYATFVTFGRLWARLSATLNFLNLFRPAEPR
jgi:hypothetical protein